ncbi:hypothetical protein [Nocardia sp. GAS34]|uniref:hypothetical protein n=1 Tax=unclassified Nocardia TaxID=2637762 RepID=UPI003D1EC0E3
MSLTSTVAAATGAVAADVAAPEDAGLGADVFAPEPHPLTAKAASNATQPPRRTHRFPPADMWPA